MYVHTGSLYVHRPLPPPCLVAAARWLCVHTYLPVVRVFRPPPTSTGLPVFCSFGSHLLLGQSGSVRFLFVFLFPFCFFLLPISVGWEEEAQNQKKQKIILPLPAVLPPSSLSL